MIGIKDFGMPSCCNNCEMSSCKGWGNFYCDITLEEIDMDSDKRDKDCPLVEAIPKDQYKTRLKADLKAILVELQLEIEESCICTYEVNKLIQQKINSLRRSDNE